MTDANVQRLLHAASKAPTQQESARLVAEAEQIQATARNAAAMDREVDLANAVIADHLQPVAVHEHHTAATDWIGALDTSGGENVADEVTAQASLWYGRTAAIKPFREEWEEQAKGTAHKLAGSFGEQAAVAEDVFLTHVGTLYQRELDAGLFVLANSGLPQVGEPGNDPDLMGLQGPAEPSGLPGEATTSERAPIMQAMEGNTSSGIHNAQFPNSAESDNTGAERTAARHTADGFSVSTGHPSDMAWNRWGNWKPGWEAHQDGFTDGHRGLRKDPDKLGEAHGIGQAYGEGHDLAKTYRQNDWDPESHYRDHDWSGGRQFSEDLGKKIFGSNERNASMQTAACPSCKGRGRVAVRVQGASGLDQVDQIVDPNNQPKQTPYPTDVAFPWEMQQDSSAQIQEAENQIAQREQLKGASLEQQARYAARQAYLRVRAGQDDSGWLGDMGAGGVTPGEQDGGNPGSADNISQPDPVYGFGGDQGDRGGLKPYGADEANDVTNNPGMNWQPGQPSQYDVGGRGNTVGQPTMASRQPSINDDPQLRHALAYARQRREFLASQGWS